MCVCVQVCVCVCVHVCVCVCVCVARLLQHNLTYFFVCLGALMYRGVRELHLFSIFVSAHLLKHNLNFRCALWCEVQEL